MDPYRVLNVGMTRHKTMYMPPNTLDDITQRALDMTKRDKKAYERVVQAIARVVLEETEFEKHELDERPTQRGKASVHSTPSEAAFTLTDRPMYIQSYLGLQPLPQPPGGTF